MDYNTMQVDVFSPEGLIFSSQVYSLLADTENGELGILPGHAALVTPLIVGAIKVMRQPSDPDPVFIAVNGGILEVHENTVSVIATFAIRARDIDAAEQEIIKQEAEAELETALLKKDTAAYTRARIELKQAINQINVKAKKTKGQR